MPSQLQYQLQYQVQYQVHKFILANTNAKPEQVIAKFNLQRRVIKQHSNGLQHVGYYTADGEIGFEQTELEQND